MLKIFILILLYVASNNKPLSKPNSKPSKNSNPKISRGLVGGSSLGGGSSGGAGGATAGAAVFSARTGGSCPDHAAVSVDMTADPGATQSAADIFSVSGAALPPLEETRLKVSIGNLRANINC